MLLLLLLLLLSVWALGLFAAAEPSPPVELDDDMQEDSGSLNSDVGDGGRY